MAATQREELLALFAQTGEVLRTMIAEVSAPGERESGAPHQWTAKDLIGQVGFWMEYTVERMAYYARGETPPRQVDFDAVSRAAFDAHVGESWDATDAFALAALDRLCRAVEASSDALLVTPNAYGSGPGDPLWGEVRANGFIWPLQEIEKWYQRIGESGRAAEIHARLGAVLGPDPEPIACDHIAPRDLQSLLASGSAPLIIDVRDREEYARAHIPGARHIPLADLPTALADLPRDRRVVTYCMMRHPGFSRGEQAAARLQAQGLQAAAIAGGLPGWQETGGAMAEEAGVDADEGA